MSDHHHDCGNGHGHAHDHGHSHAQSHAHDHALGHVHLPPAGFGRAFAIGIALNTAFVVIEAGYGFVSGSMALMADAGHNLSDVLGLVIAWVASTLAARPPSSRYTYGYKSSSILAALANSALLMLAIGGIGAETIHRFFMPEPVAGGTVMAVAAVGIAINTITALMFMRGSAHDLNIRGAFLHMAGDAAVSAVVLVSGFVILRTGIVWIDSATSLIVLAVIGWSTWDLFVRALRLGLLGVPDGIEHDAVMTMLSSQPGVAKVHDLHIWPMSTTETALTAHLVMPGGHPGDGFLHGLSGQLEHRFSIHHATIQIEVESDAACALQGADVI